MPFDNQNQNADRDAARGARRPQQQRSFDLEARTYDFARDVRKFVKSLPQTPGNDEDIRQAVRASGDLGVAYLDANDCRDKNEFVTCIKGCQRQAKECLYWLRLLDTEGDPGCESGRDLVAQEAWELSKIFGAIYRRSIGEPGRPQRRDGEDEDDMGDL